MGSFGEIAAESRIATGLRELATAEGGYIRITGKMASESRVIARGYKIREVNRLVE